MPPNKRKRFNAFEDFPTNETQKRSEILTGKTPVNQVEEPKVERIERLRPSEMMPDRFQPRRLLPTHIRHAFFLGEIDCYQAAEEWTKQAQQDSGAKAEIDKLLSLGDSFDAHGQIKPITGSWTNDQNGNFIFLIETGERRYWAACLQVVTKNLVEEPLLRVEVIENPTRQRQVLENRHAEAPSAVEQACEVAALILAELDIQPNPNQADDYDYFRIARSQRMPAGLWDRITPIMQLTRPRMVQLLNILQFPSHLLDLADRFRLPERVLREILNQPQNEWEFYIHQSIQNSLTSEEIAEVSLEKSKDEGKNKQSVRTPALPQKVAQRSLRKFTRIFRKMEKIEQSEILDELADEIYVGGQAKEVLDLLDELTALLQARVRRS